MDYILIYKDKKNKKRAAIPNPEGIYKSEIPFSEYKYKVNKNEIIILESANLYGQNGLLQSSAEYFRSIVVGKFITSSPVHECIEFYGFEKFFTLVIKQYLKAEE